MATKSKFFVIGTEGDTTDRRVIDGATLTAMASTYDPKKYGARINMEHIKGLHPQSAFRAYGDVTALKTEKNSEGKVQLLAQLDPTKELVDMTNNQRQKVYTSMEINPNFANSGQPYLVGLAVTDSPASLGTDMLKFCAGMTESPLASRKQDKDNLFSEAKLAELEFEDVADAGDSTFTFSVKGDSPTIIERLSSIFGTKPAPAAPAAPVTKPQESTEMPQHFAQAMQTLATGLDESRTQFSEFFAEFKKTVVPALQEVTKLREDHTALVTQLSSTGTTAPRQTATGATVDFKTDF